LAPGASWWMPWIVAATFGAVAARDPRRDGSDQHPQANHTRTHSNLPIGRAHPTVSYMLAALVALFAAFAVPQPTIVHKPIPFGAKRKAEMQAYAKRHYGIDSYRLRDPKVIVEHYTVTSTFQQTFNTFAPDTPDSELGELPGTCAHYVIDKDGTIYQLVPRSIMCRHTVGLNYTSIGIEHVGSSDSQVLNNSKQMAASLRLTRWLRCHYSIDVKNVIGHAESLSSPYHKERVERLSTQTHGDMTHAAMQTYRAKLAQKGAC
jgi:N-acetylmuramoyl-L-alanine amidase